MKLPTFSVPVLTAGLLMTMSLLTGCASTSSPTAVASGSSAPDAAQTLPDTAQVAGAISQSVSFTKAPDGVTPSTDAVADQGSLSPEEIECDKDYGVTSASPVCYLGDKSASKTVAIWGDSHASMWTPALSIIAAHEHFKVAVFAKYGCAPALGVEPWRPTGNRPYSECQSFKQSALQQLLVLKPDTILLTGAYRGFAYAEEGKEITGGTFTSKNQWLPSASGDSVWQEALGRTLTALKATGSRIVVVGDSAYPLIDAGDCLSAHADDLAKCNFTAADGTFPAHNAAESKTATAHGATYVPVDAWLCTSAVCPVIVGTHVVYRDGYHITRQYSMWLANVFGSATGLLTK